MTKIVAISDVHCKWNKLTVPKCDILISTGDYSFQGEKHVVRNFHKWLDKQDATHIISIQGNHEKWVEANFNEAKQIAEEACPRVHFIDEGLVEIDGIKVWGSAVTPFFYNWAWNRARTKDLEPWHGRHIKEHWAMIPNDINILATHGPVYEILDKTTYPNGDWKTEPLGCMSLAERIKDLKELKVHICGHIHASYGTIEIDGVRYYNASNCDEMYDISNPVTIIEYEK